MFKKIFDLTHKITSNIPTWGGECGFECHVLSKVATAGFHVQKFSLDAGCGTHMDAPAHVIESGETIGSIPLEKCIAPLVLIDVSHKAGLDYKISTADIQADEAANGLIPEEAFIFVYTGWDQYWDNNKKYCAKDAEGNKHFPSLLKEVGEYLLEKNVSGIGIDTLSPDTGSDGWPIHQLFLGNGKLIVENMTRPQDVPVRGATSIILPLFVEQGTEAPVRAIAVV